MLLRIEKGPRGGDIIIIKCDICGIEKISRIKDTTKRSRHYCSHKCKFSDAEWKKLMSEKKSGPLNHNFGKFGKDNPNYGSKRSEKTKQLFSEQRKGIPLSEKHCQTLSRVFSGKNNPMFGRGDLVTGEKNGMYGKHHSSETLKKLSDSSWLKGKVCLWWKPWMTSEPTLWAVSIKKIYHSKCADCCTESDITAHHIVPRKECADLSFDLNNGVCLCWPCHRAVHRLLRKNADEYQAKMQTMLDKRDIEYLNFLFEKELLKSTKSF